MAWEQCHIHRAAEEALPARSRQGTPVEACAIIPACKSGMAMPGLQAPGNTGTCQAPLPPERLSHTVSPSGCRCCKIPPTTCLFTKLGESILLIDTNNSNKTKHLHNPIQKASMDIEIWFHWNKTITTQTSRCPLDNIFHCARVENVLGWRQLYIGQTCDLHQAKNPGRKRRKASFEWGRIPICVKER